MVHPLYPFCSLFEWGKRPKRLNVHKIWRVVVGRLIPCGTGLSTERNELKVDKTTMIEKELADEMTAFTDTKKESVHEDTPVEPS